MQRKHTSSLEIHSLSKITHYGASHILFLTLEFLFIPLLWIGHIILLTYFYYQESNRWRHFFILGLTHLLLTFHLYNHIHYRPAFDLNQVKKGEIYLIEDAIPNALQRAHVSGYTQWYGDEFMRIYQNLPVKWSISQLDRPLPRGSFLELTITHQEWREPFWYITSHARSITSKEDSYPWWNLRNTLKENIQFFLKKRLGSSYGLYLAVTLGDREHLSAHASRLFRESGLAHILALSGLHASILILMLFFLLQWLPLSKRFIVLLPVIFLHAWLTAFLYTILRAYIMAIISLLAKIYHRKIQGLDLLCASTIIILLIDWQALYSLSFHLSFLSILGIMLFYKLIYNIFQRLLPIHSTVHNRLIRGVIASFAMSFAVELVINPLIVFHFKEIQLFSFVSNLFIPIIFAIFFGIASLTLFIPHIKPFVNMYEEWMLKSLDFFNIALITIPWQILVAIHTLLALSLIFWHNKRKYENAITL